MNLDGNDWPRDAFPSIMNSPIPFNLSSFKALELQSSLQKRLTDPRP